MKAGRKAGTGEEALEPVEFDEKKVGFFRSRRVGRKVLITNDIGQYALLSPAQFERFLGGKLRTKERLHKSLREAGFIRDYTDFEKLSDAWKRRSSFLWQGPGLHIIVVTLRCDHRCVYCQTSSVAMGAKGYDMTEATARKVVDIIFRSPSRGITIEFQGGEPLANWPVVKSIVEYALEKNEREGKLLTINLVTNLSLMDDAKLDFLIARGVNFCTSIDGPAKVHDKNRVHLKGTGHALVTRWWKKIKQRTQGKVFGIDALMTTTRRSLSHPEAIVDEYVRLGARGMYLRPLSPYGFARKTWEAVGYTTEEFLEFYKRAMERIFALNKKGKRIFEQTFRICAAKIFDHEDPNFLDLRSPCGAGIGQIAYNFDGRVYTCDEGRMLSRMDDESFRLGSVDADGYPEIVNHPTVRALAAASCLENQAECEGCAYLPYCGTCPVENYVHEGDLFPRTPSNPKCRLFKGIFDYFFERTQDPEVKKIVRSWTRVPDNPLIRD